MRIHWFNPENDLALASNLSRYTPPAAARQLHDAGATLPLWYGAPGDHVLCYGVNDSWLSRIYDDFDIATDLFDHTPTIEASPCPWGWSAAARTFFINEGFDPSVLLTVDQIERLRNLSHRRTAAEVCRQLLNLLPDMPLAPPAVEVSSVEALQTLIKLNPGRHYVFKSPWSGSGRGVVDTRSVGIDRALRQATDSIRRYGCVMLEQAYDKRLDFARLFECKDGKCQDLGTSVFTTDNRGTYRGNLLACEADRLSVVAEVFPIDRLEVVVNAIRSILQQMIAPEYTGILGVDMLVTADGMLDATVEINLRHTMGYVANRFADSFLQPGCRGEFLVLPHPNITDDYQVVDHRISRGVMLLNPPNPHFAFVAKVTPKP